MVSLGNFDLNDYQKVSDKDQEAIDAETDPGKKARSCSPLRSTKQWRNKALSDTYEPGSTFKIITLAMALEEGVVNENSSFYCGGSIDRARPYRPAQVLEDDRSRQPERSRRPCSTRATWRLCRSGSSSARAHSTSMPRRSAF